MPEFRMIDAGSARIRAAVDGEGPLVLMAHGFPEGWYSYRHQMTPIAEAGFTACAIDVRGYGGSQTVPAERHRSLCDGERWSATSRGVGRCASVARRDPRS